LGMVTGAPLALRHEVGELGWFGDESVQTVVQPERCHSRIGRLAKRSRIPIAPREW
jgi:hypothetical protein